MTEREDHQEAATADLVDAITRTYRDRKQAGPADRQPPAVGVEAQAAALADAAARLAALTAQPRRSLNPIAVLRDLSRAAGSIADSAAEPHRQEWFDLADGGEARSAWDAALAGLRSAEGTSAWAAGGWI